MATASLHVARPRDRRALVVKAGRKVRDGRLAVVLAARDGVALDVALGVVVANVVQVRRQPFRHRDEVVLAPRAVHGARELAGIGGV